MDSASTLRRRGLPRSARLRTGTPGDGCIWTLVATGRTVAIGIIADLPVAGQRRSAVPVGLMRRRRRPSPDQPTAAGGAGGSTRSRSPSRGGATSKGRSPSAGPSRARSAMPLRDRCATAWADARASVTVDEVWPRLRWAHHRSRVERPRHPRRPREARRAAERARSTHATAMASALKAQLDTASRMQECVRRAQGRLRLLNAPRLGRLVAPAVELSVSGSTAAMGGLGDDVDVLVQEMEALRQAVEEIDKVARPELPPLPPPGQQHAPRVTDVEGGGRATRSQRLRRARHAVLPAHGAPCASSCSGSSSAKPRSPTPTRPPATRRTASHELLPGRRARRHPSSPSSPVTSRTTTRRRRAQWSASRSSCSPGHRGCGRAAAALFPPVLALPRRRVDADQFRSVGTSLADLPAADLLLRVDGAVLGAAPAPASGSSPPHGRRCSATS